MIGNAVPVKLGEYIANRIIEYIQGKTQPRLEPTQLVLNFGDNY